MANKPYKPRISAEALTQRINDIAAYYGTKGAAKKLGISPGTLRKYRRGNLPKNEKRLKEITPKINRVYKSAESKPDFSETITDHPKAKPITPTPAPIPVEPAPEEKAPEEEKAWHSCPIYPDYMYAANLFGFRGEERLEEIHNDGYRAAWYGYANIVPKEVVFTLNPDNPTEWHDDSIFHVVGITSGVISKKGIKTNRQDEDVIVNSRIKAKFIKWSMKGKAPEELNDVFREFFFSVQVRKPGVYPIQFLAWYVEE